MIVEIRDQLKKKPDTIFCSVGGGGLLGGIIVGCKGVGWDDGKQDQVKVTCSIFIACLFSTNCNAGNHRV